MTFVCGNLNSGNLNSGVYSVPNQVTNLCQGVTSVNEITKNSTANIYPNPFSENTTLHFTSYLKNAHIKVYNMTGKLVKEDDFNGNDLKIERNDLSEGLYLFQVNADNNYQTKGKMIIE